MNSKEAPKKNKGGEEEELLKILQEWNEPILPNTKKAQEKEDGMHPLLTLGLAAAFLAHGAILFSLPPVLKQKGAPFLPTNSNNLTVMFNALKKQSFVKKALQTKTPLTFYDLGSGDGRVVFRAAREGIFHKSVGYEINPVLHMFASMRRLVTPKYFKSTSFRMDDLWKVDLSQADVIAVYGLYPIMGRLGKKMEQELKLGSIVGE